MASPEQPVGQDWENHADRKNLQEKADTVCRVLNTTMAFDAWQKMVLLNQKTYGTGKDL